MHVESSTMLDRNPLELPLHRVDSFSEDSVVYMSKIIFTWS